MIRGKAPSFHEMLDSWRSWLDGHTPIEALAQLKPLRVAFHRYNKLYVEQKSICENDKFVQEVAAGVARMARATRLEMHEQGVAYMLPKRWAEEINDAASSSLTTPNSQIRDLHVKIFQPSILSALVRSEEEVVALKAAMQGLTSFSFWPLTTKLVGPGEIDAFSVCWRPSGALPLFSFGSLTRYSIWENLQWIQLCHVPIYLSELERLFGQLSKPIDYLNFHYVQLVSGTWDEALDTLHNKDILSFKLFGPSGGKLDDLTWKEQQYIFAPNIKNRDMTSRAEEYVRSSGWEVLQNPITTVLERRNINVDPNSGSIEDTDSDE
ncbi:hypothetical protein B0O99DRAFT_695837 [Bisporella sp. PMI_857]|nr:hypothetical protein B0O99DRAFT_695837 [Bisporella sp. PMI_857]